MKIRLADYIADTKTDMIDEGRPVSWSALHDIRPLNGYGMVKESC